MKRIVFLILILALTAEAFSQVRLARKKHFKNFFESTTYIVEDNDPFTVFNKPMREAIEKHWTITPVEFITFDEFQRKRTNDNYSFMIYADIKQDNWDEVYEFINFVMGDKKRDFERMPDLGSVPLSYRDVDPLNYHYKMGAFVKFMQNLVQQRRKNDRLKLSKFINANDERLKQMELWLLKHEVDEKINTEEKVKRYYPYKVKFVSRNDIKKAIDEDNPNVALLHKIGPEDTTDRPVGNRCWKFILSAETGEVLYSSQHEIDRQNPDGFLISDLEEIAKD